MDGKHVGQEKVLVEQTSRLRVEGTAMPDRAIMRAWPPDPWFQSKANLSDR